MDDVAPTESELEQMAYDARMLLQALLDDDISNPRRVSDAIDALIDAKIAQALRRKPTP